VSLRPQRLCLESFPKLGNETLFILALVEMVMLMGLDPIPIPELLRYLRAMGHGDETVVVDGSFFTAPVAKRLDGVGLRRVLCAIVAPMPQDESEPDTVLGMDVIGSPEERVPMQAEVVGAVAETKSDAELRLLERRAFYRGAGGRISRSWQQERPDSTGTFITQGSDRKVGRYVVGNCRHSLIQHHAKRSEICD